MANQSLAELKAENAAAEAEPETIPQVVEEEAVVEAVDIEPEEKAEVAEPDAEETGDIETEDWMKSDGENVDKKYSGEDIGNAKAKLRAKLEKKHNTELEDLKAENDRLKNGRVDAKSLNRPKREDYYDTDDPDDAFAEALVDWKLETNQAATATTAKQNETKIKANEFHTRVAKGVDQHYERAVKLSEDSGISAELYQSSDLAVRQAVESVFPNAGDTITDTLIANLGEGSEKVLYSLGINTARRNKFKELLSSDTSGMQAAMYLGSLKSELNAPGKRKTNAPAPAGHANGDANASNDPHKAHKKSYDAANKSGDTQAAFTAKMAAKKAGANVKLW